jgi:hypothetical protein
LDKTVNAYSAIALPGEEKNIIHQDLVAAMNDDRCIYEVFKGSTGRVYVPKWNLVAEIIRKFIPDFSTNPVGELMALEEGDKLRIASFKAKGIESRLRLIFKENNS